MLESMIVHMLDDAAFHIHNRPGECAEGQKTETSFVFTREETRSVSTSLAPLVSHVFHALARVFCYLDEAHAYSCSSQLVTMMRGDSGNS